MAAILSRGEWVLTKVVHLSGAPWVDHVTSSLVGIVHKIGVYPNTHIDIDATPPVHQVRI